MRIRLPKSRWGRVVLVVAAIPLLALPAAAIYYQGAGGAACARCHEIQPAYHAWEVSSHRTLECKECHGSIWTVDPGFHMGNVRRLVSHATGDVPERVMIREKDAQGLLERCRACHRAEFAAWQAGPHGATYERIFLDEAHNRKRLLMDDCLRCHGMYFEGGIGDVVEPVSTSGPWRLRPEGLAAKPVMPCLACHQVHREGSPRTREDLLSLRTSAMDEVHRPSLAFYDRRQRRHVPVADLPLPEMNDGERKVAISPDPRQALCYQCHAPLASFQVRSGDDRTPVGVHEGLSCLSCHAKHTQTARASCAACHPRLSNCGIPVETMDTNFRSRDSQHDIHFVKCEDCHPGGRPRAPPPRAAVAPPGGAAAEPPGPGQAPKPEADEREAR